MFDWLNEYIVQWHSDSGIHLGLDESLYDLQIWLVTKNW